MNSKLAFIALSVLCSGLAMAQSEFNYSVQITSVSTPAGLPGLHSYAWATHNGKWLIIGGRKDGLHARQPFNAFPQSQNNTNIYVVDMAAGQTWNASVNTLPTGLKEQLQSTNMNFYQDGETLYIVGGYAFSTSADDHITFDKLTSVDVPGLIDAIITGSPIGSFFKQTADPAFAVCGGQMGKIGNNFLLVGGHQFDGRYNPMGNPTYTQTYTNEIRKFTIDNSSEQLSFGNYEAVADAIHLHRRDYNLLPQILPGDEQAYAIASGVFQLGVNLPYLYPVEITDTGYSPVMSFTQYLSNYHCAHAALYDSGTGDNHSLFFGGMSRYYYQNGNMVQDDLVPFVKTVSLVTRASDGQRTEYLLPVEMPNLTGASAEFIMNESLPHYSSGVIKLAEAVEDTLLIGHIFGGINSNSLNPFDVNQTNTTSASGAIYEVKLIKSVTESIRIPGSANPFDVVLYPNPVEEEVMVSFDLQKRASVYYYLTDNSGKVVAEGPLSDADAGNNTYQLRLSESIKPGTLIATFIFDDVFFVSKRLVKK